MYTLVIQRPAQIDIDEAFIWYEEQSIGLGIRLIEDFDKTADKIISNPSYAGKVTNELRGAPLSISPYEIVYITDEKTATIIVIALSHFKRAPHWYKKRR
ncbi:MAG: hypothetical protein QM640_10450 [Niabella sp.]